MGNAGYPHPRYCRHEDNKTDGERLTLHALAMKDPIDRLILTIHFFNACGPANPTEKAALGRLRL